MLNTRFEPDTSSPLHRRLETTLADCRDRQLYRQRRSLDSAQGAVIRVDGRDLLNFCSNDYLGLASDKRLAQALQRGGERWGVGSGASHLVCGHSRVHQDLEQALAVFTGREAALLFSSGYAANLGTLNGLLSQGDQVYQDRLNHASLLDGGWISRADFRWYDHANADSLNHQLNRFAAYLPDGHMSLVVSDGVFSMDGDTCPLEQLAAICRQHRSVLMIDDAHGIGCYGPEGQGLVDPHMFSSTDVPILMGTLGKAFGTAGAFVAGNKNLIDYLVQKSRNYIYTTAIPPAIAEATLTSLDIIQRENWRREKLRELIALFRQQCQTQGLPLSPSRTAIQPLIVGDAATALAISRALEQQGICISAIRPPTVPGNSSRLRITLTAQHTVEQVQTLVTALATVIRELDPRQPRAG